MKTWQNQCCFLNYEVIKFLFFYFPCEIFFVTLLKIFWNVKKFYLRAHSCLLIFPCKNRTAVIHFLVYNYYILRFSCKKVAWGMTIMNFVQILLKHSLLPPWQVSSLHTNIYDATQTEYTRKQLVFGKK